MLPADVSHSSCSVQRSDQQLLDACRARADPRRIFESVLPPEQRPRTELRDPLSLLRIREGRSLEALSCPVESQRLSQRLSQLSDMEKYEQRVSEGGCHSAEGLWGTAWHNSHKCVLITVAELFNFRPGHLLLDWGSGCGHMLSWAKAFYDVDGLGIEVTPAAPCQQARKGLQWYIVIYFYI